MCLLEGPGAGAGSQGPERARRRGKTIGVAAAAGHRQVDQLQRGGRWARSRAGLPRRRPLRSVCEENKHRIRGDNAEHPCSGDTQMAHA